MAFRGATDHFVLRTESGLRLKAVMTNESALRAPIRVGDRVHGALHADDIGVLPV